MTELIMKLLMPMLILMISHPRYQRCQTQTNRYILETALPITETKKRKHFAIKSTPQNLGKLTSATTFGHLKVVFGHCYVQNVRFLKILQCPDFEIFLVLPDTFSIPKSLTEVMGDLIFLKTRS